VKQIEAFMKEAYVPNKDWPLMVNEIRKWDDYLTNCITTFIFSCVTHLYSQCFIEHRGSVIYALEFCVFLLRDSRTRIADLSWFKTQQLNSEFVRTAVRFNQYFWTPYPFVALVLIILFECFLFYKFLSPQNSSNSFGKIFLTLIAANTTSFFGEYYLSIFFNQGYTILVWVPWVKVIGSFELKMYLISFPIIFVSTALIEFIICLLFLRRKYQTSKILISVFLTNLISTTALILIFNCIVFNFIKGGDCGYWVHFLPEQEISLPK
jgi:hypothetical protein